MREIKFRAWDGVLHEYRTIDMNSGKQNLGMGFESTEGIGSNTTTIYHSFGDVIEQYTGIDDADGGPIYEGDILQDVNDGIIVGAVTYDDKEGMYECNKNCMYDVSDCKVVGNIHMNPELLEEELR